jgi:transglutaminase-like putative cysteine protease
MRLHHALRCGVLLLGAAAPLVSFGQFQAPSNEELKMTSDPKAPGAAAVYLYREETEDDPHSFCTVYARIKVLTEKGKEAGTVHVRLPRVMAFVAAGNNSSRSSSGSENHFDAPDMNHVGEDQPYDTDSYAANIEVKALDARVVRPDGTVVPLTGSVADLVKVNKDTKEATFTLPGVEVGSIIEYRYQVRYDRFQSAPQWQIQQPYFVHKAHYLYTPTGQFLPSDVSGSGISTSQLKDRHYEILNDIRTANILPPEKAVGRDALGRYFLDLTDIPAIPQEAFAPPVGERIYQMNFYYTYTVVEKEYWQKEMQFWIKDLNRYTAPSGAVQSAASEAVAAADTPLIKAKKLYALVQKIENTDLSREDSLAVANDSVPLGNVQTVLENKRGNGNQIAFLYLALARAAGLEVRAERIASRNHHIFTPSRLSTDQLDAVLIAMTLDGKQVLLDPGTKLAPFGTLHWAHSGAGGITMGSGGKVENILTPLQLNTENTAVRVGTLAVTPEGTVSGTLKVGFTGQEALELRQLALRTDANAVKQLLEKRIAAEVPDGIVAHVDRIAGLDDPTRQLVAVVPVSGSLAAHEVNRLTLPRLFFDTHETVPFPEDNARTLPVDVHYPSQEQEQITYQFPAGFSLETAPQDTTFKWEENAVYQVKSKADAGSITSARVLGRGFTMLEAKDYEALRGFYEKVAAADQQKLVLTAGK